MNERIAELYDLAIGHTLNYHDEKPKATQKELDRVCAAEFSRLIVQECAGIAYEYDIPNLTGPGEFIGNRMKKLFGVE